MPTPSVLFWGIILGSIGMGYFVYGKKQGAFLPLLCGLGLMVLPYVFTNLSLLLVVSLVLVVLPFILR